jgi:hypothetical protein
MASEAVGLVGRGWSEARIINKITMTEGRSRFSVGF